MSRRNIASSSFAAIMRKLSSSLSIFLFILSAPRIDHPSGRLIFYLAFVLFEIWLRLYKKLLQD